MTDSHRAQRRNDRRAGPGILAPSEAEPDESPALCARVGGASATAEEPDLLVRVVQGATGLGAEHITNGETNYKANHLRQPSLIVHPGGGA